MKNFNNYCHIYFYAPIYYFNILYSSIDFILLENKMTLNLIFVNE